MHPGRFEIRKIADIASAARGAYRISPALAAEIDELYYIERIRLGIESVYRDLNGCGERRRKAFEKRFGKKPCVRMRNDAAAYTLTLYAEWLDLDIDIQYTLVLGEDMTGNRS